jgi:hypothetical protein
VVEALAVVSIVRINIVNAGLAGIRGRPNKNPRARKVSDADARRHTHKVSSPHFFLEISWSRFLFNSWKELSCSPPEACFNLLRQVTSPRGESADLLRLSVR